MDPFPFEVCTYIIRLNQHLARVILQNLHKLCVALCTVLPKLLCMMTHHNSKKSKPTTLTKCAYSIISPTLSVGQVWFTIRIFFLAIVLLPVLLLISENTEQGKYFIFCMRIVIQKILHVNNSRN